MEFSLKFNFLPVPGRIYDFLLPWLNTHWTNTNWVLRIFFGKICLYTKNFIMIHSNHFDVYLFPFWSVHPFAWCENWFSHSKSSSSSSLLLSALYSVQLNSKRCECTVNSSTARKLYIHQTMNKQLSLLPVINDKRIAHASGSLLSSNRFVNDLYWLQFSMLIT